MERPITEWLAAIQRNEAEDYDNVFLFTGEEGSGKSNTAIQVFAYLDSTAARRVQWARRDARAARDAWRLDPDPMNLEALQKAAEALGKAHVEASHARKGQGFDVDRIVFTRESVFQTIDDVPKGGAFLWDEADINRRKAMHGDLLDVIDTLQTNRAQLLKFGMCFPRGGSADRQILERIRWLVHHPRKGIAEVTRYWTEERATPKGIETVLKWKRWGTYHVHPNKGAFWNAYLKKKEDHMRSTRRRKGGMVVDIEAIRPIVQQLRRLGQEGQS
jgi:hypothetical protein